MITTESNMTHSKFNPNTATQQVANMKTNWNGWKQLGGVALLAIAQPTLAQVSFDSGSNGSDGVFNPVCVAPDTVITVDVEATQGLLQYSSMNVGANCIVRFTPTGNSLTTKSYPIQILVQGDALIDGEINVNGSGVIGGPGGYNAQNVHSFYERPGLGPEARRVLDFTYCPSGYLAGNIPSHYKNNYILRGKSSESSRCGAGGSGALLLAVSGTLTVNKSIQRGGGMAYIFATTIHSDSGLPDDHSTSPSRIEALYYTGSRVYSQLKQLSLNIVREEAEPIIIIKSVGGMDLTPGEALIPGAGTYPVVVNTTGLATGTEVVLYAYGASTDNKKTAYVLDDGTATIEMVFGDGHSEIDASVGIRPLP